jgi:hypothetical protein
MLGQATGIWTHLTHHGPDSREATTFPLIVFSAALRRGYIQMAIFLGTPKLESRNCPEIVLVGVPGLWELITPHCKVWSQRGLNQTCSPRRDLSNDMTYRTLKSDVWKRSIPDFSWSGVKLPIWLPTLLLPITWAADVQMANARPFSISALQDLSNDTKNTSMQGVLGLDVEL